MKMWEFPSNNNGPINGIADAGVETFKGTPIKSLAREICQNSLDARNDQNEATVVEFKTFEIPTASIPGIEELKDAFRRALDFWSRQNSDKAKKFFKKALDVVSKNAVRCMRISDFNTSGLTGSHEAYNSPWCNLTKSQGASDKGGTNGGSFGIGKFAPFACSDFRTVFYSTSNIAGEQASQGVARLTSFKRDDEEITQGVGFYGNEKSSPVYEQFSLEPEFNRAIDSTGTPKLKSNDFCKASSLHRQALKTNLRLSLTATDQRKSHLSFSNVKRKKPLKITLKILLKYS